MGDRREAAETGGRQGRETCGRQKRPARNRDGRQAGDKEDKRETGETGRRQGRGAQHARARVRLDAPEPRAAVEAMRGDHLLVGCGLRVWG